MKKSFVEIASAAFTENLTQEQFLEEFKKNPQAFCSLRLEELDAFANQVVEKCCELAGATAAKKIKAHFDAE